MIHFAGHLDEQPNHCIECQQAFSSRHDFVQHLRVHVLKPSKYHRQQCDVCGEIFRGSMKAHLLKHGMNTYSMKTCSYCDYTTHKTSILNKHLRTHSGEKMFLCDLCPKSYTSAVYLKEHKLSVHERERKFYCHLCTKSFYTKLRLRRHIKTHGGDRPFKCEQCGRGFTTAYNMRTHQRLHTGVKPYQCKLCEAAFVQKTSLDCHMKKHGIVTQRRPQSCETGPDKQDQTDYLSKHQPQQYFEQVDNSGPPPPPRKTPAVQSSAKEDLWPSGPGRQEAGEEHSQDETWPSQVPRAPVPQLLAPQLWARKAAGDPSRPEPWARKSFEESFRDDLWARKTVGESSRDDAWGAKSAPEPPRDALWGRNFMGESSKEVMWAGQQPSKPIAETSAGTAWASLATRKSSFREPPRVLPWPNLLGQRAHFAEPSLSSESGPQDFSFSMEQTFARAAESSEPTLPRAPVFPSQGSEADKQTLGSYSMILHY